MLLNSNVLFGLPEKMIMDSIHGGIYFFPHEQKIIDHPLFQRLRFILQNDILTLVFPGSQHTRFQHSIGVMHLSGRFFQGLVKSHLLKFKNMEEINLPLINSINYVYGAIRLAALLHDTGHAPFSHQFEHSKRVSDMLNRSFFEKLWEDEDYSLYFNSKPDKIEHEHISIRITHEIFKENLDAEIKVEDVIYFMEKSENKPSHTLSKHIKCIIRASFKTIPTKMEFNSLLDSIPDVSDKLLKTFKEIISGEIDADKMDYILRDSYFSGSKYGYYNVDVILNSLQIGWESSEKDKSRIEFTWIGIAIDPKGLKPMEDFIHARFKLYVELYNHKTVCGFKYLLAEAIDEVLAK